MVSFKTPNGLISFCSFVILWSSVTNASAKDIGTIVSQSPHQFLCEGYVNNNWEIFIMDVSGANKRNLTNTPDIHELYPKVSPDGSQIAFVSDVGKGRKKIRSIWIMGIDGKNRKKVADYARQPFWAPNGRTLGFLPQEYKKFSPASAANKGIMFYDLKSGKTRPHVNSSKINHIFNPCFSKDGKWIIATVHGGMGVKHSTFVIEANGMALHDLKVHGCRSDVSPDGTHIAWCETDHLVSIARIDWAASPPVLAKPEFCITDKKNKIYHAEWVPGGQLLLLSRGPSGKGDITKPGTVMHASETVGVYAKGWNIIAVALGKTGELPIAEKTNSRWTQITHDGNSYKEPDSIPVKK